MNSISNPDELEHAFFALLEEHDCTLVRPKHLAVEAYAHVEASIAYDLESDSMQSEPFFHYVVTDGIAIFLIDGDPFLVYAFRCDPHELITYVESALKPTDVEQCKEYVAAVLGKRAGIAVSAEIAHRWMADHAQALAE